MLERSAPVRVLAARYHRATYGKNELMQGGGAAFANGCVTSLPSLCEIYYIDIHPTFWPQRRGTRPGPRLGYFRFSAQNFLFL